jgi:hypothetical protein
MEICSCRRTEGGRYRLDSGWTALTSRRGEKERVYTGHPFDSGSGLCLSGSFFFYLPSGFGSSSRRSPICAIHFRSRLPWFALVSRVVSALFLECGLNLYKQGHMYRELSIGSIAVGPHLLHLTISAHIHMQDTRSIRGRACDH